MAHCFPSRPNSVHLSWQFKFYYMLCIPVTWFELPSYLIIKWSIFFLTSKVRFLKSPSCLYPMVGLDINVCPIPVKTDVGQVSRSCITVVRRDKWKNQIPKRAGTTEKYISTGIKYWVCCIKESCLISNLSIIYFD